MVFPVSYLKYYRRTNFENLHSKDVCVLHILVIYVFFLILQSRLSILICIYFSDTENIRFVFAAVKDTILQSNLKEYNLV